jgi:hypothetical protein
MILPMLKAFLQLLLLLRPRRWPLSLPIRGHLLRALILIMMIIIAMAIVMSMAIVAMPLAEVAAGRSRIRTAWTAPKTSTTICLIVTND